MKVKGLKWNTEMSNKVWFEKKFKKLYTRYMRKVERLIHQADRRGIIDDDFISSIVNVANTELVDCNTKVSFDSDTNTFTGVISPEAEA